MYHPQCELLMPHESLDMDAVVGQSHLAASGVSAIPAELNFHLLHHSFVDTAASPQPPTVDYFFPGTDPPPAAVQFEQLAATNHHAMSMLRDYYGQQYPAETYLRGGPRTTTGSSSLVFGVAHDDESAAYNMVGPFVESSPTTRAAGGGRKRNRGSRAAGGPAHGGVEKKEKQRRLRLTEKYTALMLLIPNRTKVLIPSCVANLQCMLSTCPTQRLMLF